MGITLTKKEKEVLEELGYSEIHIEGKDICFILGGTECSVSKEKGEKIFYTLLKHHNLHLVFLMKVNLLSFMDNLFK